MFQASVHLKLRERKEPARLDENRCLPFYYFGKIMFA